MARDDLRPSQDPDLQRLQELALRGHRELDELDADHTQRLWDGVRREALEGHDRPARAEAPRGRARPWWPVAAAAAVALVVGVALGTSLDGTGDQQDPAMLASVELEPLAAGVDGRSATLREDEAGRTVVVDLGGLPATDGFHEVWLLDPDTGALVSLGPVRADDVYAVPDTVDLVDLSVLDVSAEPQDGDPGHSGDSLLRGEVRWTG